MRYETVGYGTRQEIYDLIKRDGMRRKGARRFAESAAACRKLEQWWDQVTYGDRRYVVEGETDPDITSDWVPAPTPMDSPSDHPSGVVADGGDAATVVDTP